MPVHESKFSGDSETEFRRDPLKFLTDIAREQGDVARFRLGSQDAFLLNHPDFIRDVLVTHQANFQKARAPLTLRLLGEGLLTSDGAFHRRQRRLVQPAFHHRRIAAYADTMIEHGARLRANWRDTGTIDASEEMRRLMLGIVAKTLFGADIEDAEAHEVGEAMAEIRDLFETTALPHAEPLDETNNALAARRFQLASDRLDSIIYRIIAERRRSGIDHGDLISMLVLAQEEESGDGDGMTDEQVRDEAMTIFLAGHDTTTNALTWTWYLLSQHPQVEAKLHAELDAVLHDARLPRAEDFSQLVYAEMIVSEALRLYPPAWRIGRRVTKDFAIGGHQIPAGSLVFVSQHVTHRDARWFDEPERFDPERWTTQTRDALPPFAYFPFGGGAHRCIGEGFARTASVLLLATLASGWRLRLAVNPNEIQPQPLLTLRPKHGMPMTLQRR